MGNLKSSINIEEEDILFKKRRAEFQKANSPEQIMELYNQTLNDFPERYKYSISDYAQQGIVDILERNEFLKLHIRTGEEVIDIGCSDGFFVFELAEKCRRVVGVDMLEKHINRAKNTAKMKNISNVDFILGFAERLPFSEDSFDTSILSHMLEHVHNPDVVIREAVRVTKQNGQLIAIVPHDIGRDPTHIRCITSEELYEMLGLYGQVSQKYIVGTKGIGVICTLSKE